MVIQKGPTSVGLFCCQVLKSVKKVGHFSKLDFRIEKRINIAVHKYTNTHNYEHNRTKIQLQFGRKSIV